MNRLSALVLALAFVSSANAGPYVAGSYGQTTMTKTTCPKENFSCEPRVVGWKAAIGYRVNKYLALEAQWVDLGRANRYALPTVSDFELGRKGTHSFATVRGPAVVALGFLPLGERFSLYAGGGLHALKVRTTVVGRPLQAQFDAQGINPSHAEGTTLGPVITIGAQVDLTKRWVVRAEFDHFHRVGGSTMGGLTEKELAVVSAIYTWGQK